MPLKKGSSRKIISTNIKEFHTGKTYAHTASKFGKERANKQAIAVALNTARRFSKRASGGKVKKYANEGAVEPNPEFDPSLQRVYINPPPPPPVPISGAPEGYQPEPAQPVRPSILDYIQPREDFQRALREQAEEYPAYLHEQGQENIQTGHPGKMLLGAGQEVLGAAMPAIAPIGAAAETVTKGIGRLAGPAFERMADVGSWIGPGAAEKSVLAGLGFTATGAKNVSKINDAVFKAVEAGGEPNKEIFTAIKQHYPKDVAQSAYYLGLGPEDVGVLKQYMLPGAQEAFDKHYQKLLKKAPKKEEAPPPEGQVLQGPESWFPETPPSLGSNFGEPINMDGLTKIKNKLGTNPGGVYTDEAGSKFYIKRGQTPDHVRNELTASALYDLAGTPTLRYRPVEGGKHIATEWAMKEKDNAHKFTEAERKAAQEDFAVHAWLANYDAVGTGGDNLGIVGGKPTVLDTGGALEYRAQGKPKGDTFGVKVNEIDSMRGKDPDIYAPDAAAIFGDMSAESIRKSVAKVAAIPDEKIIQTVEAHGGSPELAQKLIARKLDLMDRFNPEGGGGEPGKIGAGLQAESPKAIMDTYAKKEFVPEDIAPTMDEGYHYDPTDYEAPVEKAAGKRPSFMEAFPAAFKKAHGEGKVKFFYEPPVNLKDPDSWATISQYINAMREKPISESGISPYGMAGTKIKKFFNQMGVENLIGSLKVHKLSEKELSNVMSYMPHEIISDMKGFLKDELKEQGYQFHPSWFPSQKVKEYTTSLSKINEHLNPIEWKNYRPEEKHVKHIDFGGNDPQKIQELGFNINFPLLKGGEHLVSGYPSELLDPINKPHERALFMAHDPHIAKQYGAIGEPYLARATKAFEVNWESLTGYQGYDSETMHKVIEQARKKGADLVVFHKMSDLGGGDQTQYAILNTAILRGPKAKFDPAKLHLRYPLAGLAGGGILAYGTLDKDNTDGMKRGGTVKKKHPQIDEDPQEHEFINFAQGGLIDSDIPGRTDKIPMRVSPGSYVLPADIPSALGQGNTKAGHEILKKMFTHSAYGLPPPNIKSRPFHYPQKVRVKAGGGAVSAEKVLPPDHQLGMRVPKGGSMCANCKYLSSPTTCGNSGFVKWNGSPELPDPANEYCCDLYESKTTEPEEKAKGGKTDHVPIVAAGGEYVIHPDVVKHIGHGDMTKGHKVLDKFVVHTRKQHIETLRKLKPPK